MKLALNLTVGVYVVALSPCVSLAEDAYNFSPEEITFLEGFLINKLPPPPVDHSNRYADEASAVELGHLLFFDTHLSKNGKISCAHCHKPEQQFTDGRPVGFGSEALRRNTPSVVGTTYSPWFYWDGRKDSLWSQALEPLESATEHGLGRVDVVRKVMNRHGRIYQKVFGHRPNFKNKQRFPPGASPLGNERAQRAWHSMRTSDRELVNKVFSHIGKAIMAYERKLLPTSSRFDRFVEAVRRSPNKARTIFNEDEVIGLRLFMGRANCSSCHNGPLFTNFEFHNIGAPEVNKEAVDLGRADGVKKLRIDEFNCLSPYSDAQPEHCEELAFLKVEGMELLGAFKTPSLRNVTRTAPYMQSGQFENLVDVLNHYNRPVPPYFDPKQHTARPHFDIMPLGLTDDEKNQIIAFLGTLASESSSKWMTAPSGIKEER